MARRPASISRAVMRARLVALSPNSPKDTELPRSAKPAFLPLNCLRYLVRLGCNTINYSRGGLFGDRDRRRRCRRYCCSGRSGLRGIGLDDRLDLRFLEDLALEDPHLDADHAVGGARLGEAIVDVGTESVQRNAPFPIPLGACHPRAVQAPGDAHLHAKSAASHG